MGHLFLTRNLLHRQSRVSRH